MRQACARGHHTRNRHGARPDAARRLQRAARASALRRAVHARLAASRAAVGVQSAWRGARLRRKLRSALDAARFSDSDDEFEYEAVDDGWLEVWNRKEP